MVKANSMNHMVPPNCMTQDSGDHWPNGLPYVKLPKPGLFVCLFIIINEILKGGGIICTISKSPSRSFTKQKCTGQS